MLVESIYHNGNLLLPKFELNMTSNQLIGILTDVQRKQLLMNQFAQHSNIYLFQAQQSEYMR